MSHLTFSGVKWDFLLHFQRHCDSGELCLVCIAILGFLLRRSSGKCDLYLGAFFCICKSNLAGVTDVVLVERESDRVSKSPHHHRVHHEHGSRKAPPLAYLIFGLQIGLLAKSPDWIHPLLLILEARSVHWTDTQSHSISMLMMMSTLQLHTRLLPFHLPSHQ